MHLHPQWPVKRTSNPAFRRVYGRWILLAGVGVRGVGVLLRFLCGVGRASFFLRAVCFMSYERQREIEK
jgi:hypothetical protein